MAWSTDSQVDNVLSSKNGSNVIMCVQADSSYMLMEP